MKQWHELLQEHLLIRGVLDQLEVFILEQDELDRVKLSRILSNIESLWNPHEIKEEKFLRKLKREGIKLPSNKMIIEEHRQFKGHWKVLNESIKNKDDKDVWITLDTDGRMIIKKLRDHMEKEEISIHNALHFGNVISVINN